jgi:hypothetical protein
MRNRFIVLSILTASLLIVQLNHTIKTRDDKPPVIRTKATREESQQDNGNALCPSWLGLG